MSGATTGVGSLHSLTATVGLDNLGRRPLAQGDRISFLRCQDIGHTHAVLRRPLAERRRDVTDRWCCVQAAKCNRHLELQARVRRVCFSWRPPSTANSLSILETANAGKLPRSCGIESI